MRNYPANSPESMGRLVALTLMADGAIDPSELKLMNRQQTVRRLGLNDERFDALIHELCEDMLISAHRNRAGQLELDAANIDLLLTEIDNPALQKRVLRIMLDIVNADRTLSGGEAVLVAEAMKVWGIDLYELAVCVSAKPRLQQYQTAGVTLAH
jgi:uncharacterized tellurite resistance protein B-like protein